MKDFLKMNLILLIIMNAMLIPLWIRKSIFTQSLDIKEFIIIYLSMIICIFLGSIVTYTISLMLDKIARLK